MLVNKFLFPQKSLEKLYKNKSLLISFNPLTTGEPNLIA